MPSRSRELDAMVSDVGLSHATRARLFALADCSPDAIVVANDARVIVAANAIAADIFGRPCAELIGAPLDSLIVPEDPAGHRALAADSYAGSRCRRVGHIGVRAMHADGTVFPAEISARAIDTDNGELVVGAIRDATALSETDRASERPSADAIVTVSSDGALSTRDVTERRRAERATAQLAAIVESCMDAIYTNPARRDDWHLERRGGTLVRLSRGGGDRAPVRAAVRVWAAPARCSVARACRRDFHGGGRLPPQGRQLLRRCVEAVADPGRRADHERVLYRTGHHRTKERQARTGAAGRDRAVQQGRDPYIHHGRDDRHMERRGGRTVRAKRAGGDRAAPRDAHRARS